MSLRSWRILFGLIAASLFLTRPAVGQSSEAPPPATEFYAADLDAFMEAQPPYTKTDVYVIKNGPRYLFEGVLVEKPKLRPESAAFLTNLLKALDEPMSPTSYTLVLKTKNQRSVKFLLQNDAALFLLELIQRTGPACCIGRPVRVWARYFYHAMGVPGLAAVRVEPIDQRRASRNPTSTLFSPRLLL